MRIICQKNTEQNDQTNDDFDKNLRLHMGGDFVAGTSRIHSCNKTSHDFRLKHLAIEKKQKKNYQIESKTNSKKFKTTVLKKSSKYIKSHRNKS